MKPSSLMNLRYLSVIPVLAVCAIAQNAPAESGAGNIVQIAKETGQFSTLLAAAETAGLAETLAEKGPFTIFAPTDDAFAKLPGGAVSALLKDPDRLREILLLHVVSGKLEAAEVVQQGHLKTLLGQDVAINTDGGPHIGGAKITATDIHASNGVIHVIDSVILPADDIVEVARSAGSFQTLLAALEATGLDEALRAKGPFTVFAPTDEAFSKLPEGTVEKLLAQPEQLKSILLYHVVRGAVTADKVVKLSSAETLQGGKITIDASNGAKINDAQVITADVRAHNGVIHVIDTVLLPE